MLGIRFNGKGRSWGAWVAQSVKRPTLAQVMTSRFVISSPESASALTARSLEPASDSLSLSLSLSLSPGHHYWKLKCQALWSGMRRKATAPTFNSVCLRTSGILLGGKGKATFSHCGVSYNLWETALPTPILQIGRAHV